MEGRKFDRKSVPTKSQRNKNSIPPTFWNIKFGSIKIRC